MKGYSFQELVKLAEAAVKRAGDIMTGDLTAPKVLVSGAQGTEANTLTRKDYVDNELSKKLSLTGGTMTGALYIDQALHSGSVTVNDTSSGARLVIIPQGDNERFTIDMYPTSITPYQVIEFRGSDGTTSFKRAVSCDVPPVAASHLTRKDYVDTELSRKLSLTGDTMTGDLTISNFAPIFTLNETDTGKNWLLVADGNGCRFQMDHTNGREAWNVNSAGTVSIYDPISITAQGGAAGSLTRKDYVDGQVATRAPTTHTHTVAAITDLSPQNAEAIGSTLALRDPYGDISARLFKSNYPDEATFSGALAYRANNSTDNYTRYCSNPTAVRNWLRSAKTPWNVEWRALIEHTYSPMTEYHIPGNAAVITYLTADGSFRISSSQGGGVDAGERLRIDSAGSLFVSGHIHAGGRVHDMGQRVYSPNNQPHYSHNHTAAQGNSDIVAGGHSQVGTYMLAQSRANTTQGVGYLVSGAYLCPSSAGNRYSDNVPLSGTWKLLGAIWDDSQEVDQRTALWIRVS